MKLVVGCVGFERRGYATDVNLRVAGVLNDADFSLEFQVREADLM